jgi:hypothetical protein
MPEVRGDIIVRCPVEDVFDCVADERHETLTNPDDQGLEKPRRNWRLAPTGVLRIRGADLRDQRTCRR